MEDRRGQTGIYCRVIAEQLKEILLFACAAGGDDGHGTACGHGVQQLQIKAVLHAVSVDGVHDQLARAVFDALLQPVQRVDACVLAPALGEQHEFAVHTLNIGGEHHALVAVFLRGSRDDAGVADGPRVDADLVRTAFQHAVKVVQRVDAAADGQRDKNLTCDPAQNIGEQPAPLDAGRDVVEHQLVRAGGVVVPRHLDGIGHVLQSFKVDTLDHAPVFDVQTRNYAFGNHVLIPPRTASRPRPDQSLPYKSTSPK